MIFREEELGFRLAWGDLEVEKGARRQLAFERILYLPPLIRDRLSSPSEIQYSLIWRMGLSKREIVVGTAFVAVRIRVRTGTSPVLYGSG